MSDQTDTTPVDDDQVVTPDAQGATDESTHPWGDDFDPNRAWNTIQQQRAAEKALKDQLEAEKAAWDDEDAAEARLREKYPHWFEEDDDEPVDTGDQEQPTVDPRLESVDQRLARIEAQEAEKQFKADFAEALGEREVNAKARKWIEAQTVINGNDRDALQAAVDEWFEITTPPAPPEKKRAPHVPAGGPPADPETPQTHADRVQRAMERMSAEQA